MRIDPERAQDLLEHVVEAIARINRYTESGESSFFADEMAQDAVIRNLEIIGEACHGVEKRFPICAEKYPELPLRNAYEMRAAESDL